MSNTKTVMSQAANTLTTPLEVEDVFSTYLYEGNNNGSASGPNPTRKITNGINLEDEGGLIWFKVRDTNPYRNTSILVDSERSDYSKAIFTSETDSQSDVSNFVINSVQQDGFTLGYYGWTNFTDDKMASWTFRKAPKFFDVVTYTGTGSAQSISHNLGSVPGVVIVKDFSGSGNSWTVYHRSAGNTGGLLLNDNNAFITSTTFFNDTTPTDTQFTVGNAGNTNALYRSFVAYLFAHNDGDGEFGPDGDADIIKCGSYTSNNSTDGPEIDLGFEPQFVIIKMASDVADWAMFDNMRGVATGGNDAILYPNKSDAEGTGNNFLEFTSTGFKLTSTGDEVNTGTGNTYIYIAIRRGTKVPESADEVFAMQDGRDSGTPSYTSNFPVDFTMIQSKLGSNWNQISRLQGGQTYLYSNSADSESSDSDTDQYAMDLMDGIGKDKSVYSPNFAWMWKRAPNYFDVVAYTGDGTAGRTVSHNLGVAPEMMWVKGRDTTFNWAVYSKDLAAGKVLQLNVNNAQANASYFNSTTPTGSVFYVNGSGIVNGSGNDYIAYLFATLDGISKVGSYTGNGSSQTIDCGFTSGARLVLIKSTSTTGDWLIADTERGIVAGSDPYLELNTTNAEVTSEDWLDPDSSGFVVNEVSGSNANTSGVSYIFYAVA